MVAYIGKGAVRLQTGSGIQSGNSLETARTSNIMSTTSWLYLRPMAAWVFRAAGSDASVVNPAAARARRGSARLPAANADCESARYHLKRAELAERDAR